MASALHSPTLVKEDDSDLRAKLTQVQTGAHFTLCPTLLIPVHSWAGSHHMKCNLDRFGTCS